MGEKHRDPREFCLIVEGSENGPGEENGETEWWEPLTMVEHVEHYIEQEQLKSKDAIKRAAKRQERIQERSLSGLSRRTRTK